MKVINKVYKFRIYPNKEQEILLSKHFGCSRFVYNYFLNERKELVENYDLISIEDLNVKGVIIKNRKLSKHIAGVSTYKCDWYGKELVKIGRFYPSSKTCSCCGHIN